MSASRLRDNRYELRRLARFVVPALVILVAMALRVYNLGAQSIWFDEGWSWHLARLPLGEMARVTADDRSPLLYYTLLHAWIDLTGESSFAMRYLSVCADAGTVALVMVMARAIFKQSSRFPVAGLLYAICPFAIWYAQETRMYALVAAFCVASCYWLWRWLLAPTQHRALFISAGTLALAIYSHYYAIFLLPAQALAVLAMLALRMSTLPCSSDRRDVFKTLIIWAVAAVAVIAALVPWLLYASAGFAYDDGFVFPLNTIDGRIAEWLQAFASGGLTSLLPAWSWAGLAAAFCASLVVLLRAKHRRTLLFLGLLACISLLSATVAVRFVYPYRSVFHPRYLIYVVPLVVILLGGAAQLAQQPRSFAATRVASRLYGVIGLTPIGIMAVMWLPLLNVYYTDPAVARDDVHHAMTHVVEALAPDDLVVMTRDNYAVQYYLHTTYPAYTDRFVAMPAGLHGVIKSANDYVTLLNERNPKRVRLFLWQDGVVDPQKLVESTLWANGYEIGELSFGQIRLPLYEMTNHPLKPLVFEPLAAHFGDTLDLTAKWSPLVGKPDQWFYVVLQWRTAAKLPVDYKVFVHVLYPDGSIAFQRDKLALSDLMPMTSWKTGETMSDAYAMVIPASLPDGDYRVAVGVYDPNLTTGRLHAKSDDHVVYDDAVILGTLQVRKR